MGLFNDIAEIFEDPIRDQSKEDKEYMYAYSLGKDNAGSESGHWRTKWNGREEWVDHCPFKEGTPEREAYFKGKADGAEDKKVYAWQMY